MLRRLITRLRTERGSAAIVETMFVAMPLVLLMTGVLDLAANVRADMRVAQAAYYAAQSVAREGVYSSAAGEELASILQGFSSWQVSAPTSPVPPGTEFTVDVSATYALPLGFWQQALPTTLEVTVTGETLPTAP